MTMSDEEYLAWRQKMAAKRVREAFKVKYTTALRMVQKDPDLLEEYFPIKEKTDE